VISQPGNTRGRARVIACVALALALCQFGLFAPQAEASLDLILEDAPDISVAYIDISYNADTDQLVAFGYPAQFKASSGSPSIDITDTTRRFDLTAEIDESGNLATGSLSIQAKIPDLGFYGDTLLTGNLTALGFPSGGGDPIEFLFEVTGGDAGPLYTAAGYAGGIILSYTGLTSKLFSSSFSNTSMGQANVGAVVPEPMSMVVWLLLAACVAAGWWRRRAA